MASCDNCGTFVTPDYARVFGDNDGVVHGCPECMALRYITDRADAASSSEVTATRTR